MYCPKCGSFVTDEAQFCPNCNEPIIKEAVNEPEAQQNGGVYYTPQQNPNEQNAYYSPQQNNTYNTVNDSNYNPYGNPQQNNAYYNNDAQQNYFNQGQPNNQGFYQSCPPNQAEQQFKEVISSANTLGILAIVLGILLTPLAGIICGAVGLSKLNNVPDMLMNPLLAKDKAKAKKLNIWGIVLPTALYIIAIIFMIIFVSIMGLATADMLSYM